MSVTPNFVIGAIILQNKQKIKIRPNCQIKRFETFKTKPKNSNPVPKISNYQNIKRLNIL